MVLAPSSSTHYSEAAQCIPFDGHADFFSAVGHRLHNTGHPTNLKVLLGGQPPGRPPEALILMGCPHLVMEAVAYGRKKVRMAVKWDNLGIMFSRLLHSNISHP
jgi:hypothetical protein